MEKLLLGLGNPELARSVIASTARGPTAVRSGTRTISYNRHRFPPDVIRYAVWLYLRRLLQP
jgi:hypothetical protein